MGWRGKRKILACKDKLKLLKSLFKNCKNSTEQNRIQIAITYMLWNDIEKTTKILWVSIRTVQKVIDLYSKNETDFYKTNYKWKVETEERKKLKSEVKELVEEWIDKEKFHDINGVLRTINKRYNKEVTNYNWMRWIIRRWLNLKFL